MAFLFSPSVPRCRCFLISLGYRDCFPSFATLALPPLGLASLPWSWSFLPQWFIAFFCLGIPRSFTLAPLPLGLVVPLGFFFQVLLWPFHLRPWVFPPLALALWSSLSARFSCSFFARASSAPFLPKLFGSFPSLSLASFLGHLLSSCGFSCWLFCYTPSPSACGLCLVACAPLPLPFLLALPGLLVLFFSIIFPPLASSLFAWGFRLPLCSSTGSLVVLYLSSWPLLAFLPFTLSCISLLLLVAFCLLYVCLFLLLFGSFSSLRSLVGGFSCLWGFLPAPSCCGSPSRVRCQCLFRHLGLSLAVFPFVCLLLSSRLQLLPAVPLSSFSFWVCHFLLPCLSWRSLSRGFLFL